MQNATGFLAYCRHLLDGTAVPEPASELPKAGIYRDTSQADLPLAAITFYRSVLEGAQTAPIDALVDALLARGIGTKAFYVASLKDQASVACLDASLQSPDIILNATSFAIASGMDALSFRSFSRARRKRPGATAHKASARAILR